jgi:hypothetical protein
MNSALHSDNSILFSFNHELQNFPTKVSTRMRPVICIKRYYVPYIYTEPAARISHVYQLCFVYYFQVRLSSVYRIDSYEVSTQCCAMPFYLCAQSRMRDERCIPYWLTSSCSNSQSSICNRITLLFLAWCYL